MKKLIIVLLASAVILSCKKKEEVTFDAEKAAFFDNLIEPTEAAARIQATGAEFNDSLLSDPANAGRYANDPIKASANLGIYLSDLNYSIAFKQSATTSELFGAAHTLSQTVGVEHSILQFLMERYTNNLQQNDSAQAIVHELFQRSTFYLKGTDRENMVGIAMCAYQIENLHLALGTINSYPKDMLPEDTRTQILIPVYRMVLGQKANVERIAGFLKYVADSSPDKNPNYQYYADAFQELIDVYNRLNIEEKIANNQGLELMNDAVAIELSQKVEAIRNKALSY